MSSKVSINLYDLSQGMAKNMSRNFLGKQIDGIWHTGIVVYGKEFYYGGGICQDPPGRTPYGNPMKSIPMGETEIPEDIFLDFLKEINCKFTAEKYDLFENNCNNFSDACSEFLTGTKIPNYITGLPREVLNTPMGQMIKPMIDRMQKGMTENSHPMFASPNQGHGFGAPNHVGTMDPTSYAHMPHYAQQQSQGPKGPISITDANEFSKLIKNSAAVIVDFFSYTCPPCMKIKPFYERLAQDFGVRCPDLKFVSVDTGIARQIAMNYQITSIPTFIAFLEGSQFQRFSGADAKRVETLAYTLESKIIAKGGQSGSTTSSSVSSYNFNLFNPSNKDFYTFSGTNYALPIKSINTTLEGFSALNQPELKETFTKFSENPQESVQKFSKEDKTHLINWLFETIFYISVSDKTVGLLDLVRMLSLDHSFLEIIYTHQDRIQELVKFLDKSADALKDLPKGLKLVLLRLLTNLTASEKSKPIFQDNLATYIDLLTKAGTAYKDDKTAVHPVIMTLWNLVQNFYDNKSFEQAIKVVINFVRTIYNTSNETDVLLGCSLVLTWLSFHRKEFRNEINDKIEMPKLAKLEFIEDPNLGKISRDFSDILRGKAN